MSEARIIYTELRRPLLRTAAVLAIAIALTTASGWFNARMQQARQASEQQYQGAVLDYRTAIDSEQILRSETDRYLALREAGFVGAEPRLRWVEDVRDSAARANLVAVHYELEPRHPQMSNQPTGSYQLYASAMKLSLMLRHEGDLLRFLELLEARRGGLFEITACTLRRSRDGKEISLSADNLKADCSLRWYSLDTPAAAAEGESP